MTIQFFESFNTHARIPVGLDGGGDQDTAPFFINSTFNRHQYQAGPSGYGQALRIREYIQVPFTYFPIAEYGRVVVGGHFKKAGPINDSNVDPWLFEIGAFGNEIRVFLESDGDLQVQYNGVQVGGTITAGINLSTYKYIIADFNSTEGRVRISVDGGLAYNQVIPGFTEWTGVNHQLTIGRITIGLQIPHFDIVMDNFWIATEPPTADDDELLAVKITSTQDRYNASLQGLLGTLIIDGQRYEADVLTSGIASIAYDNGKNVANTMNHMYFTDPSTGEPFTEATFSRVTHWGVCYGTNDPSENSLRLAALALQKLVYNNGQPVVEVVQPGPAAYFSGNWVKSHPDLAFFAHVNKHPRDDDVDIADVTSLYIDTPGCMLFLTNQSYDPEPIETVGITFAEEKRIDYADWCLVLGGSGVNYDSWFISGYSLAGQGDKFFADNYLTVNYANVENGAAYAQGVWDYANAPESARWSMRQAIYAPVRVTTGAYTHGSRKLMMRGQGRALQVRVSSQRGKAFRINGWNMYITGNSKA